MTRCHHLHPRGGHHHMLRHRRPAWTPPTLSGLAPEYTDDDIKGLLQTTKLCGTCRLMFGPKEDWVPVSTARGEIHYKHHTSYESFHLSMQNGCRTFTMLQLEIGRCCDKKFLLSNREHKSFFNIYEKRLCRVGCWRRDREVAWIMLSLID